MNNIYGKLKNFGEFIVVSDPISKIPLFNFRSWKEFSRWMKVRKLYINGDKVLKKRL